MVTIVSATPHHSVVKEKICGNCGATLQYVPRDIKKRTVKDYTGGSDTYEYIDCPVCGDQITVRTY